MFNLKTIFALFIIAAIPLLVQTDVFACTCGGRQPLLDSLEQSESVLTTKLISVEKIGKKASEFDNTYIRSVKMRVEKVYKGNVKAGDVLTFAQGGGSDCILTYDEEDVGKEYLFYLDKPLRGHPFLEEDEKNSKPMYRVEVCGRSNYLNYAADDLLYLNKTDELRGLTRISGTLSSGRKNAPSFADLKIKITGNDNEYEVRTNENGTYQIYDLPAGEYKIEPQIPQGWKIYYRALDSFFRISGDGAYRNKDLISVDKLKNQFFINLKEDRHAELDWRIEIDNHIRGKVLSPAGEPMPDVCLQAISTKPAKDEYRRGDCTNEKGEFEIDQLDPGDYILAVNDDGKITVKEPFETLFYPGIGERNRAAVISIGLGEFLNDFNIQIPKIEELIEISGRFVYSDGKPVSNRRIIFIPLRETMITGDNARAETDDEGRFTIRLLNGQKGRLEIGSENYLGVFGNCAELEKMVAAIGRTKIGEATNGIELTGGGDIANGKFTFLFSDCARAKD